MKRILFGTTNEAKIKQVRGALAPANIEVQGVNNKEILPDVKEDGQTPVENARKKAVAYAKALREPVFSIDNALYLKGLTSEEQPGLNIKRIKGFSEKPTDKQMVEYYSQILSRLGGKVDGYWEFGVCIANPEGKTCETIIKSPRIFTDKPSDKIVEGFPLDSIQIDPESGKYISEMTQEEQDSFWQKAIGKPLLEFVQSVDI